MGGLSGLADVKRLPADGTRFWVRDELRQRTAPAATAVVAVPAGGAGSPATIPAAAAGAPVAGSPTRGARWFPRQTWGPPATGRARRPSPAGSPPVPRSERPPR